MHPRADGDADRREQRFVVDRLAQITLCTQAEGAGPGFGSVVRGDDDDRDRGVLRRECALDLEAIGTWHMQVEEDTIRFVVFDRLQKRRAGRESLNGKASGGNQSRQRNAYIRIVVDYR